MALANLSDWNSDNSVAAASACGTSDKPAACGSGDKPEEKLSACGSACGAGDK